MEISDDFPMMMEREAGMPETVPPVAVSFGMYPIQDAAKSRAAGHDVFVDVEYVKIAIPGDRHSLYFQPASEDHKRRFPKAYAAFKARSTDARVEGMPIEHWAPVSRSLAMTMKAAHIHTVEALAAVHDSHIDRFGFNAREMRAKAQAWLQEAKEGATAARIASEKEELQNQLKALKAEMAAVMQAAKQPAQTSRPVAHPQIEDDVQEDVVAAARGRKRVAA